MPYRNERGGWRVRRNYGVVAGRPIPRFDLPIGTDDEETAQEVEKALDRLTELGSPGAALLYDVATKQRRPIDVYRIWEAQEVKEAKGIIKAEPLAPAWERFLATARRKNGTPLTDRTKFDYRQYLKRLVEVDPDVTVQTLPVVLEEYRLKCVDAGHNITYMKVRAACLSFARNTQHDKQRSELWYQLARVDTVDHATKKGETAIPVYELREIIDRLPTTRLRNVAWGLAATGMRIAEYAGKWEVKEDRLAIYGTKSAAATRIAPVPIEIIPEPFSCYVPGQGTIRNNVRPGEKPLCDRALKKALKEASNGTLTPHDLRHCYQLWLIEAGVLELRQDMYMGHAVQGLRERYGRHRADLLLAEDTERLVAYIESTWERPKANRAKVRRLKIA